ncbi:TPA: hypothetical protein ACH3X2_003452 [Trebouxia sp. C0005]
MAAEKAGKTSKQEKKPSQRGPTVTDTRFEAAQWDPRFQRFPKAKRHVEIDKRFEGMFSKPEFQQHSTVDKRGREVANRKNQENMRKYYKLKDEDAWRKDAAEPSFPPEAPKHAADGSLGAGSQKLNKVKAKHRATTDAHTNRPHGQFDSGATLASRPQDEDAVSSQEEEAEEDEVEHDEDLVDQRWARARGLLGDSSSEEEDAAELAADSDQDEALVGEWGVGAMAANPDEHIPDSDETHRLAVVDLDWDKIRAVDLLAVLRSFLGKGQTIRGVTVYPSDFGLQKMKEEAAVGPQSIFGKTVVNGNEDKGAGSRLAARGRSMSDSESGEEHSEAEDAAELDAAVLEAAAELSDDSIEDGVQLQEDDEASSSDDSGNEVDQRRLQLYERSRLRYYYAVVDCQDVRTAAHLYAECDGIEFLRSACKLDMRFVPDEQSFVKRQVRDTAEEVPPDYAPPDFTTAALQHTNVKLTWDADDDTRKKALRKKMTEDSIRDDDFKAYLASSSEESAGEGDAAALRDRYRSLLLANTKGEDARTGGAKGRTWSGAASGSDSDSQAVGDSEGEAEARGKKKKAGKDMDMEVTFTPGLEGLGARLLAQRKEASQRKGDTVWEAYLRRQKEKKLAAKAQGRRHASSDDESEDEAGEEAEAGSPREQDPFFQHEDNPFDDPFFRVWPLPLLHLSMLLICLCRCTGLYCKEVTAFSTVVQASAVIL